MSGPVFAIGGHESKTGEREILAAIARALPQRSLAVVTVASEHPQKMFDAYRAGFDGFDVELVHVHVEEREDARRPLPDVGGVFFTGGDQLRITSLLGKTDLETGILDAWHGGAVVAGTSAGASVLSETMMVRGTSKESATWGDLEMGPGIGLLPAFVIDQHFAERGRIGRLVAAIAENPRLLGLGIDEDTAVVVQEASFTVIGSGGVTVLDASGLSSTNVDERGVGRTMSVFDLCGHLLAAGDTFDIPSRRPGSAGA